MNEEELSFVDREILKALRKSKKGLSTYGVAKTLHISWSTANTHCYKLKAMKLVNSKKVTDRVGSYKMMWKAKK